MKKVERFGKTKGEVIAEMYKVFKEREDWAACHAMDVLMREWLDDLVEKVLDDVKHETI